MTRPVQEFIKARHALIDEQIAAGITSPKTIADKLRETEPFLGLSHQSRYLFCYKYLKDKGVENINQKYADRRALIDEQIAAGGTSPTAIVSKIKDAEVFHNIRYLTLYRLCFERLKEKGIKTQKTTTSNRSPKKSNTAPTVESSSELKRKIADLESQLADLRGHKCSDAENELKNENQELRTKVRQLEGRIEILSRGTRPSVVARPGFGG